MKIHSTSHYRVTAFRNSRVENRSRSTGIDPTCMAAQVVRLVVISDEVPTFCTDSMDLARVIRTYVYRGNCLRTTVRLQVRAPVKDSKVFGATGFQNRRRARDSVIAAEPQTA